MKALVLSAGYGERLRPLTNSVPKPLLEIAGRPLIHYPLLMLRAAGIREVAINVHHLAGQIEHSLGNGSTLDLSITYSYEATLMGTGGPLLMLRQYFDGDSFIIVNCDTIMDLDIGSLIAFHRERGGIASLVLRATDSTNYSRIELDDDLRIRRMLLLKGRTPGEFNDYSASADKTDAFPLQAFMYCGVMICEPAVLDALPSRAPFGLVADLLAPLLSAGKPESGFVYNGLFRTVDDRAGYERINREFGEVLPPLSYLK